MFGSSSVFGCNEEVGEQKSFCLKPLFGSHFVFSEKTVMLRGVLAEQTADLMSVPPPAHLLGGSKQSG